MRIPHFRTHCRLIGQRLPVKVGHFGLFFRQYVKPQRKLFLSAAALANAQAFLRDEILHFLRGRRLETRCGPGGAAERGRRQRQETTVGGAKRVTSTRLGLVGRLLPSGGKDVLAHPSLSPGAIGLLLVPVTVKQRRAEDKELGLYRL